MEFKEFISPEDKDYDISSSLTNSNVNNNNNSNFNQYAEQLTDLIGILEDLKEEELQEQYGISMNEYFNPNEETIAKVTEKINNIKSGKRR